jgi:hypothetical protein
MEAGRPVDTDPLEPLFPTAHLSGLLPPAAPVTRPRSRCGSATAGRTAGSTCGRPARPTCWRPCLPNPPPILAEKFARQLAAIYPREQTGVEDPPAQAGVSAVVRGAAAQAVDDRLVTPGAQAPQQAADLAGAQAEEARGLVPRPSWTLAGTFIEAVALTLVQEGPVLARVRDRHGSSSLGAKRTVLSGTKRTFLSGFDRKSRESCLSSRPSRLPPSAALCHEGCS